MRPLWSGSINFGLINIPVRLFSGSQSNTLDLDMLREHIGVLKPYEHLIVLDQLRYQEEIRPMEHIKVPRDGGVKTKELEMAISLIDHLTTNFKPKVCKDTYIEDLKRIIEQKARGIKPRPKGEEPRPSNVRDLMKLLKTSIESQKQKAA